MHKCFFSFTKTHLWRTTCKDNNVGFSLFLFSPMWTKCFLFKSILYAMQVQCLETSIAYFRLHGVNITSNNVIIHGVEIQMSPSNLVHGVQNLHLEMNDVILVQRELKWMGAKRTRKKWKSNRRLNSATSMHMLRVFFPSFFSLMLP